MIYCYWTMRESCVDFCRCHYCIANELTCDRNSSIRPSCWWPYWHRTLILLYCLGLIAIWPLVSLALIGAISNYLIAGIFAVDVAAAAAVAFVASNVLVASDLYYKIDAVQFLDSIYYYFRDPTSDDVTWYFDSRMWCCCRCCTSNLWCAFDAANVMMKLKNCVRCVRVYDWVRKCYHHCNRSSNQCDGLMMTVSLNWYVSLIPFGLVHLMKNHLAHLLQIRKVTVLSCSIRMRMGFKMVFTHFVFDFDTKFSSDDQSRQKMAASHLARANIQPSESKQHSGMFLDRLTIDVIAPYWWLLDSNTHNTAAKEKQMGLA